MGEVTEAQRKHAISELAAIEKRLSRIRGAWKDKKRLGKYSVGVYDRLMAELVTVFESAQKLAEYMNKLDSDTPPFNIFKGNLDLARHGVPNMDLQNLVATIENIKYDYFDSGGKRIERPKVSWQYYKNSLTSLEYALNCFRAFRLVASCNYRPTQFRVREVLDKVFKYRHYASHHDEFVFNEHVDDLEIVFDKDALYWIAMRMLSNAEHATYGVQNAWIRVQTFRHGDGNAYLLVRNNGMTIAQREAEARTRGGGKSRPNIEKLCKDLDSAFKLKGFPDHTRACLRLPLAKD